MSIREDHDDDDAAVETALRTLKLTTPSHVNERILANACAALPAAAAAPTPPRHTTTNTPSPLVRLRRAAIFLLTFGVAAAILVKYLRDPGLTFAQVQEAVARQTWVHVKYDDGREYWTNLVDGRVGSKYGQGSAAFVAADGAGFWGHRNQEYISTVPRPATRPDNAAAPAHGERPRTAWDLAVAPYLRAVDDPKAPLPMQYGDAEQIVEKATDTLDGRKVVRLDVFTKTVTGERRLVHQIWADPETRLPLQITEWNPPGLRPAARIGKYDFPETGPESIHDLGIARGLPLRTFGQPPPAEVKQVLDSAAAAARKFPQRYRSVDWIAEGMVGRVDVVWRDGDRLRTEMFIPADPSKFPAESRRSVESVLKWCETQTPYHIQVYDGEKTYWRMQQPAPSGGLFKKKQPAPKATVGASPMAPWSSSGSLGPPHLFQWPTSYPTFDGSTTTIAKDPDAPAGTIVLESDIQGYRYHYWLDPAKGYVCFRRLYYLKEAGKWKPQFDDRLEDVQPLGDSWAGKRIVLDNFGVLPLQKEPQSHQVMQIDVKPVAADEFPKDAFEGKKLLEGDVQSF